MKQIALLIFATALSIMSFAQKGMPSKQVITMTHTTNYPQHLDFKPAMLAKLKVPEGWKLSVAASGIGKPRMMCIGDKGQLYITRRDVGDVLMLKDTDGDNVFDELLTIIADFKGVHGIAIKNNYMYLVSNRVLRRYIINTDGTVGAMETWAEDLPDGGQHPNRTIHFSPDGKLFLSVGSTCNDCGESNKENATMIVIDTLTHKRTMFARGLRNTIGFDWQPSTGELWGADNGADAKGEEIPPEELNNIVENGDYGWPLVYGKQVPDETREDPPGTTKAIFAKMTKPSSLEFPAHSAPIDFRFFGKSNMFPMSFENDALVTWHGSWDRKNPKGYKVQRVKFDATGKPVGSEDFLTGFFDPVANTRFGRPAGLAISNKGMVFVSDDENGIIYCICPKS